MILNILRGNLTGRWVLLKRLTGKQDFVWLHAMRDRVIRFWLVSLFLIALAFVISLLFFVWLLLGIFLAIPGFVAFIIFLIVLSIITARITNAETNHDRFSLLCLTSITDRELALSFLFAGIYRVRRVLPLLIGFCPLLIVSVAVTPAGRQLDFSNANTCWWVSPLGNSYCDRVYTLPVSAMLRVLAGSLLGSAGLTISILGVVILTPILTTGLLFVFRNEIGAVVFTLFLVLPIASLILFALPTEGFLWLWYHVSLAQLISFSGVVVAVAVFSYVLTFAVARLAERWARKPLA
jgi:hypothetical protein